MTSIKACVISDSYSVFRRMYSYLVMHSLLLSGLDSLVSSNPSLTWKGGMVERMSRAIEVTKKRELTITNTWWQQVRWQWQSDEGTLPPLLWVWWRHLGSSGWIRVLKEAPDFPAQGSAPETSKLVFLIRISFTLPSLFQPAPRGHQQAVARLLVALCRHSMALKVVAQFAQVWSHIFQISCDPTFITFVEKWHPHWQVHSPWIYVATKRYEPGQKSLLLWKLDQGQWTTSGKGPNKNATFMDNRSSVQSREGWHEMWPMWRAESPQYSSSPRKSRGQTLSVRCSSPFLISKTIMGIGQW